MGSGDAGDAKAYKGLAGDATDPSSGDDIGLSVESGDDDGDSGDDTSDGPDAPTTTEACFPGQHQASPPTVARASFAIAPTVAKATLAASADARSNADASEASAKTGPSRQRDSQLECHGRYIGFVGSWCRRHTIMSVRI